MIAWTVWGAKQAEGPSVLGVLLLRDVREAFDQYLADRLPTLNVLLALKAIEESPWAEWSRGTGLDARSFARLLKPFRISPHNIRFEEKVTKGYERADFEDAWATFLPPQPSATTLQGASTQVIKALDGPLPQSSVAAVKTSEGQ